MIIIGKAADGSFIVTAQETEMANICGFSYASSMPNGKRPEVGMRIEVSQLYQALCASRERKADIAKLADDLRKVAGRVDSINQALASPIVEVKS
jgi:hypothetical protein